jgi:hypothetical protein
MADIGAGPVLAQAPTNETARRRLLCPFTLQMWDIDRMLKPQMPPRRRTGLQDAGREERWRSPLTPPRAFLAW